MDSRLPDFHKLPYQPDTLLHLFARVSHQPWAMLLHSGFAEHQHNRFDIMVTDPVATLTTDGDETLITRADGTERSTQDPFLLLRQAMTQAGITASTHPDMPFQGGALGLFGYDLGRRVETLPSQAKQDIHLPDMAVGIYDWALIADHQQQTLTLVTYGGHEARLAWLSAPPEVPSLDDFQLTTPWQSNMTREEYGIRFQRIQAYLRAGDCYQVNLAQRFSAGYRGDEWQAFLSLSEANRAPFSAFIRLPAHCVISVSPERFLQLQNQRIETRPIKGTLPRSTDPQEDARRATALATSQKDRAENVMIVDLLRNDIGRVAVPGSVRVPALFHVEPFPAVHHLVSTIEARLPETHHATDLLRACFPGGSITGAPKIRAMEIIEELEPHRRNAYCGSIGYISVCGTMDTSITIRTLIAEQGQLHCWAGGGIVADSQEQAEYQETLDKLGRILPLLDTAHRL
ncbi:aminodeoxychorismate synthase component 1 [Symbiopectobacterium purcellii]|uniref:aminodeoxychorismate synthase n=1 Tax=Symbiopectobacterium purcellii TaxID=2871826 RepID=A0ABX9AUP2_9ENTR|nr:aminodeoxychorismate synthase component 1 [Symbiopectobacterium purcellii]QZN97716.1 aminodeoxychorismate synthase component 1 [Symbiopectobacterium purcellii]